MSMLTWAWVTDGKIGPASIRQNAAIFIINSLTNDLTLRKEGRLASIDLGQRATPAELSAERRGWDQRVSVFA